MNARWFFKLAAVLIILFAFACAARMATTPAPPADENPLTEQQRLFHPRVEEVTDGVYCAIGYALANCAMVAVDGGKVIIDATESVQAAKQIKDEFDRLVPGPVKAIIYTHTHPDHVLGASVFHRPGVPVWAHRRAIEEMNNQFASLGGTLRARGARQFGLYLDGETRISNGIGPFLRLDDGPVPPLIYPTHTFVDKKSVQIGGVTFELNEAPGETHDQIFIWLPERKVLFPGDNVYKAFPNLYSTRGVSPRPVRRWIQSLDQMRALPAEYLVPGHTLPVSGGDKIQEILTAYRDAIQFVHDSVIRMANDGKSPDDMAREIKLPPHLSRHPYLQELYGKVSWSVRGIYDGYLGWFDGRPTSLQRLHPQERAVRLLPLMGGRDKVMAEIQTALENEDMQWAAELAGMVLTLHPDDKQAKEAMARALWWLGGGEANANARCYLLSSALALQGRYPPTQPLEVNGDTIRDVPIDVIMQTLPERLDPVRTADVQMKIGFFFTDTKRHFTLHIRRGVGEMEKRETLDPDLLFSCTEGDFKALIVGDISALPAITTGKIKVEGGLRKLLSFKSYLLDWD